MSPDLHNHRREASVLFLALLLACAPAPFAAPGALDGPRAVLVSPEAPRPGQPLRVLAVFGSDASKVRLSLRGPSAGMEPRQTRRGGGPPYWVAAEFSAAPSGTFSVVVEEGRNEIALGPSQFVETAKGWSWAAESLYSAWIEALFAEADERSSWKALHEVTSDRSRNLLHNHLGLGEDETSGANALEMTPECADNTYFLRDYFSWKIAPTFGFHDKS